MNKAAFDLFSDIMRYWFAGLIVVIVVRLFFSVMKQISKDRGTGKKEKPQEQMGMLEIIDPGQNPKLYGQRFALRRENTIGRAGKCDIQIAEKSVRSTQAMIYQKGNQVFIRALDKKEGVFLNGEEVDGDIPLLDGDEIELSNVFLRLHLRGTLSAAPKTPKKNENQQSRNAPWHARNQIDPVDEDDWDDEYDEDEWDEDEEWDDEDDGDDDEGGWDDDEGGWDDEPPSRRRR